MDDVVQFLTLLPVIVTHATSLHSDHFTIKLEVSLQISNDKVTACMGKPDYVFDFNLHIYMKRCAHIFKFTTQKNSIINFSMQH